MKTTLRAFALAALLAAGIAALPRPPAATPLVFLSPGQETTPQDPTGFVIRGLVHKGGVPVAGARVKVLPQRASGRVFITVPFSRQAMTDENGMFTVAGVPPGPARIAAMPERLPPTVQSLEVSEDTRVVIEIQAGIDIAGVVASEDAPVAGALVSLRLAGHDAVAEHRPFRETRTDAEGRYRLEGLDAARSVRVIVVAEGFCPIEMVLRTPADAPSQIDLDPGELMLGRIVTTGGAPVAGARIEAGQGEGYTAATSSGDGGEIRLGGLVARPVTLRAHADGYAPARLELAEPGDGWIIVLRRNGGLAGRAPAGSTLVVEAESGIYRRQVGQDGSFRWDGLPAGRVEAKAVDRSGRVLASRKVEIPEGAVAEGVSLQP
jgi:hypothetical protein